MTRKIINVGTGPDSHTGEPLRSAWIKTNDNFAELYSLTATLANVTATANTGNITFSGQTISGQLTNTDINIDPLGIGKVNIVGNLTTSHLRFLGSTISTQYAGELTLDASAGNIKLNDPLKFADGTIQYTAANLTGYATQVYVTNAIANANIGGGGVTSYNDLTDKPTIPTHTSNLTNDSGFITTSSLTWANISSKPTIPTHTSNLTNNSGFITTSSLTWSNISAKPTFATVATSGDYADLTNRPSLGNYATITYVDNTVANIALTPGPAGADGVSVVNASVTVGGNLQVTLSNAHVIDAGHVVGATGATGAAGADGISIVTTSISGAGNLQVTLSNAHVIDAGYIVGPKGDQGNIGPAGPQGNVGIQGEPGIQGNIGPQGPQGIQGIQGNTGAQGTSVVLQGTLALIADLNNVVNPQHGDAWIVTESNGGDLYFYTPSNTWDNIGKIVGPEGPRGPQGIQGNVGLQGNIGPQGPQGPAGPGADQDLNTYNNVQFNKLSLTNGAGQYDLTSDINQITFGYNGSNNWPQWIHTRHHDTASTNNAIDFFTNDGTQNAVFPDNAILGLTIENGAIKTRDVHATGTVAVDNSIYFSNQGDVQAVNDLSIRTNLAGSPFVWNFGTNGDLTVPNDILANPSNDLNLKVFDPGVIGAGVSISLQNRNADTGSKTTQFVVGVNDIELTTDFSGAGNKWTFTKLGQLVPGYDNAQDIGSPTNRVRHVYVGPGSITVGNAIITESSTGSLVIPGLTRGTGYSVEEVNDTADQTYSFAGIFGLTVIDAALYTALTNNQADLSYFADFSVTLDGEGYIDNIQVNGTGNYPEADATTARNNDMYAYIGTGSASTKPPVPSDWVQIPFRPRMKAGGTEYEFNTGSNGITVGVLDNEDSLTNDAVVTAIGFSQADGFSVTELDGGVMKVNFSGGGGGGPTDNLVSGDWDLTLNNSGQLFLNNTGSGHSLWMARGSQMLIDSLGGDVVLCANDEVEWAFKTDGTVSFYGGYTFPNSNGNAGQVLVNDGSGNLTWQDQSGGGGGGVTRLDQLADTDIGGQTVGQAIIWDGTYWINQDIPAAHRLDFVNAGSIYETEAPTGRYNIVLDSENTVVIRTDEGGHAFTFTNDGKLQLPIGGDIVDDNNQSVLGYTLPTASTTVKGGIKIDGTSITINNGVISATGLPANLGHLYVDFDNTLLSTDSSSYINFNANGYDPHELAIGTNQAYAVRIETDWEGNTKSWKFDPNGNIQLPEGGDIVDANGYSVLGGGVTSRVAIGEVPPSVDNGNLWFNSTDARTYIKYNNAWVDTSPAVIPLASTYTGELEITETTISNTDYTGAKDIVVENAGNSWRFTGTGEIIFPDNTVQTTAYTAAPILEIDGGDASSWA